MNTQQKGTAIFVLVVSLVILGCGPTSALGQKLATAVATAMPPAAATAAPAVEMTATPALVVTSAPAAAATQAGGPALQATPGATSAASQIIPQSGGTPAASAEMNLPAGDTFNINIGDSVSNGKPGKGAGNIETAGAHDIYLFNAQPGQTIYVQVAPEPKTSDNIRWQLVDSAGTQLFATCLQCSEPGDQTLDKGGTYAIIVGNDPSDAPATGTYGFKLWDVPPPQEFAISVGSDVAKGKPGAGAGFIESPGVKDVYTFTATAGQTVYFQVTQPNTAGTMRWKLQDDAGSSLFDTCLQCTEPGNQTLDKGGVYTIIVGNDNDASTGAYGFKLWDVPAPQQFTINIGDTVSNGKPGPGAGNIETPGAKDIYTFTATAGQKVTFHVTQLPAASENLRWQLLNNTGAKLFDSCLQCGDPPPQTLDVAGQYQLIVGNESGIATGNYGFQIANAP